MRELYSRLNLILHKDELNPVDMGAQAPDFNVLSPNYAINPWSMFLPNNAPNPYKIKLKCCQPHWCADKKAPYNIPQTARPKKAY